MPDTQRLRRFALFSLLGLLLAAAAAGAAEIPRPCLVMPHPLKKGGPPPLGGAIRAYDPVYLENVGVLASAEAPVRDVNMIAILVDFADQPMDSSAEYFGHALRYLTQIYDEMSDGQLQLSTTLTPRVYRLPQPMSYYGLDDSIAVREAILVRDAVRAADPDVDFSDYNAYLLFHAGAGQEADINEDSEDQIWSVFFRPIDLAYWLPDPDADKGIPTDDVDAGGAPFYVTSMVVCPETESQDGYEFGLMGVVAHEFGHWFSLPDLYDTTAPEGFVFAESQGIGAFGLMGAGIWNGDNLEDAPSGTFPAEMCAWSKYYVGWLRPRVLRPEEGLEYRIELPAVVDPASRRTAAIRIPLGGDEYLLIENRVRDYDFDGEFDFDDVNGNGVFDFGIDSYAGVELDRYLPREPENVRLSPELDGSGLLIWHIDESVIRERILYNVVNAEALQKGIDLEEADGIQDLDKLRFTFEAFGDAKDAFYAPFATEFTPDTTPDSRGYHGAESNVWITDISGPGAVMSFTVRFTGYDGEAPLELPGLVADFQPMALDLDGDGDREFVLCTVDDTGVGAPLVLHHDGTPFTALAGLPGGALRGEPIVVDGWDAATGLPVLAWVSGTLVYAVRADGVSARPDGTFQPGFTPFAELERDPGRVHLTAADLDGDGADEILIGESRDAADVNLTILTRNAPIDAFYLARASFQEDAAGPFAVGNLVSGDGVDEIAAAIRTAEGGYLAVVTLSPAVAGGRFATPYALSLGDTVRFTAPVVGDLDRDGVDDIVVGDSRGYLHALRFREPGFVPVTAESGETAPNECAECFEPLPGWPLLLGTLDTDAVSLADVNGDGYLEVLAYGPGNVLHVRNYNGTSVLELPVGIPGEDRFTAGYLAPLFLDLDGDGGGDLCLPMRDGQVRGHDARGRALPGWAYLGGTQQGLYPIVADLDDDGRLEIATVEDVTVAVPADLPIELGDESPGLPRAGRLVIRESGAGRGAGTWPVYRADLGRSGRAPLPAAVGTDPVAGRGVDELFVMPNPVRGTGDAGFHYRIADDVDRVSIEIYDVSGRRVRTLEGTTFARTDNVARWDLTTEEGNRAAPGLFLARVTVRAGGTESVRFTRFAVVR